MSRGHFLAALFGIASLVTAAGVTVSVIDAPANQPPTVTPTIAWQDSHDDGLDINPGVLAELERRKVAQSVWQAELDRQAQAHAAAEAAAAAAEASARAAPGAPTSPSSGCAHADLIRSIWGDAAEWAIGIAMRESRCSPGEVSPTGCMGLFQVCLPLHNHRFIAVGCDPSQWADPTCNVKAAYRLYQENGTDPWAF